MYINKTPNPSGAYPAPQSNYADGMVNLPDNMLEIFLQYNGFVNLTFDGDTVTAIEPNIEKWEAWNASLQPIEPPEPSETEKLRADIDFIAIMSGVTL